VVIGFLAMEIFLPYSQSLKDKRRVLNTLRDRVRGRFNAAFAELDFQDTWQRTRIGVVALNSRPSVVEDLLGRIRADVLGHVDGILLDSEIKFY